MNVGSWGKIAKDIDAWTFNPAGGRSHTWTAEPGEKESLLKAS